MMEDELETMRRQMTLLKEKLDRQTIVTDKTLRETVCGVLSNDARHSVVDFCGSFYYAVCGAYAS